MHCETCGLEIIHGSRPHNTVWDCQQALKREVAALRARIDRAEQRADVAEAELVRYRNDLAELNTDWREERQRTAGGNNA